MELYKKHHVFSHPVLKRTLFFFCDFHPSNGESKNESFFKMDFFLFSCNGLLDCWSSYF